MSNPDFDKEARAYFTAWLQKNDSDLQSISDLASFLRRMYTAGLEDAARSVSTWAIAGTQGEKQAACLLEMRIRALCPEPTKEAT